MSGTCSLIIETSTSRASLALADPHGIIEQREVISDRNHNSLLFAPLRELLHCRERVHPQWVLVGSGPGSYSGTRVGIAAAQGVALALGCPAVAVPSILAVPAADACEPYLAIGDARRGSYWWAWLHHSENSGDPQLGTADDLHAVTKQAAAKNIVVFSFEKPGQFPLPANLRTRIVQQFPDAGRLWQAWLGADDKKRQLWMSRIPQPLYLKPPHITVGRRSLPLV